VHAGRKDLVDGVARSGLDFEWMPEFECQVYWHEMPEPRVPWEKPPMAAQSPPSTRRGSRRLTRKAMAIDATVTPTSALDEVLGALDVRGLRREEFSEALRLAVEEYHRDNPIVPTQQSQSQRMRTQQAQQATPATRTRRPRGASAQPHGAESTRAPSYAAASSVAPSLQAIDPHASTGDPPLLRAIRAMLLDRQLSVETMERRASGETLTTRNFFVPNAAAVFLVDRERPVFAAAYGVPPVRGDSRTSCIVNVVVPVRDPLPLRLHVKQLRNISRNEVFVLKARVAPIEPDLELLPAQNEPSEALSHGKRPRSASVRTAADVPRLRSQPRAELTSLRREVAPHDDAAWAAVPLVESKDKTRLKRSIKQPWYHRLMATHTRLRFRSEVAAQVTAGGGADDDESDDE
jgi:hypothetical protein